MGWKDAAARLRADNVMLELCKETIGAGLSVACRCGET